MRKHSITSIQRWICCLDCTPTTWDCTPTWKSHLRNIPFKWLLQVLPHPPFCWSQAAATSRKDWGHLWTSQTWISLLNRDVCVTSETTNQDEPPSSQFMPIPRREHGNPASVEYSTFSGPAFYVIFLFPLQKHPPGQFCFIQFAKYKKHGNLPDHSKGWECYQEDTCADSC